MELTIKRFMCVKAMIENERQHRRQYDRYRSLHEIFFVELVKRWRAEKVLRKCISRCEPKRSTKDEIPLNSFINIYRNDTMGSSRQAVVFVNRDAQK